MFSLPFFLLNAPLNRPVSLRAETANMPATSVALYCCHLLLCPPVSNTRLLWLQKASHCYFNIMCPLLSHVVSSFLCSFALCCLNSVCCAHEILWYVSFSFPYPSCFFQSLVSFLFLLPLPCLVGLKSLLVPGKSPSKYGRRGSAIGIGTIEEVYVYLLPSCSLFLSLAFVNVFL